MPDRNELIASLEGRIWGGVIHKGGYIHVPQEEAEAVLELLKGESVEPILALDDGEHKLWQCGNCKVAVFTRDTKYCHNCGKTVKWDDCSELVVRCKDCKHLFDGEHTENCCDVLMEKAGWLKEISVSPDWFCADGERR